MALRQEYVMNSGDFVAVGQKLGYDWNTVCEWMQDEDLSGQDGCGYCTVSKGDGERKEIKHIIEEIFKQNPKASSFLILNDF